MNNRFNDKESLKHQLLNAKIIRTKSSQYILTYNDTSITINPNINYIGFLFLYVLEMLKKEITNKEFYDDAVLELNNMSIETNKNNLKDDLKDDLKDIKKKKPLNPALLREILKK